MKIGMAVAAVILGTGILTWAKDRQQTYDKGLLLSMDSSYCGMTEKGGKTVAGEILGTDAEHKSTEQVLCPEYVLQGDRILYRIRPRDTKHPNLLPVGDTIQYRIRKDRIYVLDSEGDSKEREFSVISMQMRSDVKDSRAETKGTQ